MEFLYNQQFVSYYGIRHTIVWPIYYTHRFKLQVYWHETLECYICTSSWSLSPHMFKYLQLYHKCGIAIFIDRVDWACPIFVCAKLTTLKFSPFFFSYVVQTKWMIYNKNISGEKYHMGAMSVAIIHDRSQYVPSLVFFGRLTSLELEPSNILTPVCSKHWGFDLCNSF